VPFDMEGQPPGQDARLCSPELQEAS
jgi:hypothetical protein